MVGSPSTAIPMMKLPPFFRSQVGVPGSDTPEGLRVGIGKVFYVADASHFTAWDVTDINDGTNPMEPKATLASALAACTSDDGDVIVMLPGQYALTAAVDVAVDRVRIVAWDWHRGMTAPTVALTAAMAGAILTVNADQVEIAGIRFANSSTDTSDCVQVATSTAAIGVHVHDCRFSQGRYGLALGSASGIATDCHVERCTFLQIRNLAAAAGVHLDYAQRTLIGPDNYFQSNVANAAYGVLCANRTNPGTSVIGNWFQFLQAGTGIHRAGTTADVSMIANLFTGTMTGINKIADGGTHGVENYVADAAGGALVDPTT